MIKYEKKAKKSQLHLHFSHLSDAFIQSDLVKNEDNRSNQNQQKSNNMQVQWQVSVSLG